MIVDTAVSSGRRRFCAKPFRHLEIVQNGDVHLCCAGWMPTPVGNVWRESVRALWNGPRAQELRRSILDDSFSHCTACPFLASVSGPVRYADEIDAAEPSDEKAILDAGAVVSERIGCLNLSYDRTCNLSCPSCRNDLVVVAGAEQRRLEHQQRWILQGGLLARVDTLYLTGSGDPFASRLCRELIRSIDPAHYPRLRIKLHTNGLLFTPEAWDDLGAARARITEVEVSVDAASAATYAVNRRGGDWQILLRRLAFIASLRRSGPVGSLQLSFVVQANNWREMGAFVDLADGFGADRILFSGLRNWSTFSAEEYARRAVHLSAHPEHAAFVDGLSDPRLAHPAVVIGDAQA